MVTLETETLLVDEEPVLRVWISDADNLDDAAVFLLRNGYGSGAFGRVCTAADLINYADAAGDNFGWYRASGLETPIEDVQDLPDFLSGLKTRLDALDADAGNITDPVGYGSVTADSTDVQQLHLYRTGTAWGTLTARQARLQTCLFADFAYAVTDSDLGTASELANPFVMNSDQSEFLKILSFAETPETSWTLLDTCGFLFSAEESLKAFSTAIVRDLERLGTLFDLDDGRQRW